MYLGPVPCHGGEEEFRGTAVADRDDRPRADLNLCPLRGEDIVADVPVVGVRDIEGLVGPPGRGPLGRLVLQEHVPEIGVPDRARRGVEDPLLGGDVQFRAVGGVGHR